MADERFVDKPVVGDEIVRAFMYTKGRTRAAGVSELPLEALVSLTSLGRVGLDTLGFERRAIAQQLESSRSVAELAASLGIPLRTALIITSEMVAEGLLTAEDVVEDVDIPLLQKIREAIAAL